jgi:hypothetical protein
MHGNFLLRHLSPTTDPTVQSWLNALYDSRLRTLRALDEISPWQPIVDLMRERNLLIGLPTAEKIYVELSGAPVDQPHSLDVKGRNNISGLPDEMQITSTDIDGLIDPEASLPYLQWSAQPNGLTIGKLLYGLAVNEANWLFISVLKQDVPDDIEPLFKRDETELQAFIYGQTLHKHLKRLSVVRGYL